MSGPSQSSASMSSSGSIARASPRAARPPIPSAQVSPSGSSKRAASASRTCGVSRSICEPRPNVAQSRTSESSSRDSSTSASTARSSSWPSRPWTTPSRTSTSGCVWRACSGAMVRGSSRSRKATAIDRSTLGSRSCPSRSRSNSTVGETNGPGGGSRLPISYRGALSRARRWMPRMRRPTSLLSASVTAASNISRSPRSSNAEISSRCSSPSYGASSRRSISSWTLGSDMSRQRYDTTAVPATPRVVEPAAWGRAACGSSATGRSRP